MLCNKKCTTSADYFSYIISSLNPVGYNNNHYSVISKGEIGMKCVKGDGEVIRILIDYLFNKAKLGPSMPLSYV